MNDRAKSRSKMALGKNPVLQLIAGDEAEIVPLRGLKLLLHSRGVTTTHVRYCRNSRDIRRQPDTL